MRYKIAEEEYQSLREEMIERIKLMNTQAVNAITIVLTMWAAGVSILGIQLTNLNKLVVSYNLALCCSEIGAFFCALLILIPLSMKSGENLRQQVAISCYLKVFYYYLIKHEQTEADSIYPWEYMSGMTNDIFKKKRKKSRHLQRLANSEYPILGLLSAFFSFSVLITNYNIFCEKIDLVFLKIVFLLAIIIIEIIEFMMIVILYKNTNIKYNITDIVDKKLKETLEMAVRMGVMRETEDSTAYEELSRTKAPGKYR